MMQTIPILTTPFLRTSPDAMDNLLPHFIQDRFLHDDYTGSFPALTLFSDISGFTRMTESLMRQGDEGAEILSAILNRIFDPMVDAVHAHGGFVATFAGDAFTAIFPLDGSGVPEHVLACIHEFQQLFRLHGIQHTPFGNYSLKLKIGLSAGEVQWGILGDQKKAFFFRGEGISGCVYAEHYAEKNQIIADQHALRHLPANYLHIHPLTDGMYARLEFKRLPETLADTPREFPQLSAEVIAQFFPPVLTHYTGSGEFRNVVPLFLAFDGLSTHTELNLFVTILIEQVDAFSGYLNKLDFGDKGNIALCVWGAPVAFEDNIGRALDFILTLNEIIAQTPALNHVKLRTGITYGVAFAGIVGGAKRSEYTVLGDTVNLAARLMVNAPAGEIWISESIFRPAHRRYEMDFLGKLHFKGKSDPLPVFRLLSKKHIQAMRYAGNFVGRSAELKQALQLLQPLDQGQFGGILYIYGEAGVGKSRFVYELQQRTPHVRWVLLPCDGILRKAFNPFNHFLMRFFDQHTGADPAENQMHFEAQFQALIDQTQSPGIRAELNRLKSILAGFLGIEYPDSLYQRLDPKLRYENTLYAFREVFRALSESQPLILEVEDLHWIDEDSLKAFQIITRGLKDRPALVLVVSRYRDDGSKPRLETKTKWVEIDLNTLSDDGILEIAEERLQGTVSGKLYEVLKLRTQGNPFFIEQTVLYFQDSEIIRQDENGTWDIVKSEAVLPATVNDLLVARIDRLPPELKEAVQIAAVLGQEFDVVILLEMLRQRHYQWSAQTLENQLLAGQENNVWLILTQDRKGLFVHALLRDAVYRIQLRTRLKQIHALAAATIERLYAADQHTYADLAYHYQQAENLDKALEYLEKAGLFAKENFQHERAIEFFSDYNHLVLQKLGYSPENIDELRISSENRYFIERYVTVLNEIQISLRATGRWDELKTAAERQLKLAKKLEIPEKLSEAYTELGTFYMLTGDYQTAMTYFETALRHRKIINTLQNMGNIYAWTGQLDKAMKCFEDILNTGKASQNKKHMAAAFSGMGILYDQMGRTEEAMDYYRKSLAIFTDLNDKSQIALIVGNMGVAHHYNGNLQQALECYQKKLEISREIGDKMEIAVALSNIGIVYYEWKMYQQAMNYHLQALVIAEEIGNKRGQVDVYTNIANTYKAQKIYRKAESYYKKAISIARDLNLKYQLAESLTEYAEILIHNEQLPLAKDFLEEGLALAQEIGYQTYVEKAEQLKNSIS
ncbi:MAG: hypothetical protein D6675_13615 [Gemmatimonadetes bacterium]|nr:MAG: hypothetical protein D6675_13615 [Gemmatimonadota bacterium]